MITTAQDEPHPFYIPVSNLKWQKPVEFRAFVTYEYHLPSQ